MSVLEYAAAFLELYRQEGYYLERTVHFVARVGLDYVKKRVVSDASGRKALAERLRFALQGYVDPWSERTEDASPRTLLREYQALSPSQDGSTEPAHG